MSCFFNEYYGYLYGYTALQELCSYELLRTRWVKCKQVLSKLKKLNTKLWFFISQKYMDISTFMFVEKEIIYFLNKDQIIVVLVSSCIII